MTKASELLLLRDNEKSRLLEKLLEETFFQGICRGKCVCLFVMRHENYVMRHFILPCAGTPGKTVYKHHCVPAHYEKIACFEIK